MMRAQIVAIGVEVWCYLLCLLSVFDLVRMLWVFCSIVVLGWVVVSCFPRFELRDFALVVCCVIVC